MENKDYCIAHTERGCISRSQHIPDRISRTHPDPLWDRPVLLQLFGQMALNPERLMGCLKY